MRRAKSGNGNKKKQERTEQLSSPSARAELTLANRLNLVVYRRPAPRFMRGTSVCRHPSKKETAASGRGVIAIFRLLLIAW